MRYTFKPSTRPLPVVGQWLAEVSADDAIRVLIDATGLADHSGDRLLEHSTQPDTMWLAPQDEVRDGLVFDFGRMVELETLQIWNYNEPGYTVRGVAQADISVWTPDDGWKTVLRQAKLSEGEGTDNYDEPTLLTIAPARAQKIRLENLKSFNDEGFVGLSAIRFYEKATFAACNPDPSVEAALSCADRIPLAWTPGKEAVAHDIYAAPEGEALVSLGRIAQSQVRLTGLVGGRRYIWRVDQVQVDGSLTPGPEWSFTLEPGRGIAHWTFDRVDGDVTADTVGAFTASMKGSPTLLPDGGRFGGAIRFNGQSDYVEVPALNLNTDVMTITAWLRAEPQNHNIPGVVLCRTNTTVSGIHLLGSDLRYHWNNRPETYDWNSGLVVPTDGSWTFVALTVGPDRAVLYMLENGELKSAENPVQHAVQPFDGPLMIGRDGGYGDRYFKGAIDDVRVFNYALGADRIAALAEGRDAGTFDAADAAPTLALAGAELIDVAADLKAIAAAKDPDARAGRSNLLPVLIIVAVIVVAAAVMRKKKSAA